ncbi:MAG: hypothetical protein GKR94_11490 [Gammaproteobacteria bacterium]|nr:hypothetical protein [Gammaproteobacteria bacterium]
MFDTLLDDNKRQLDGLMGMPSGPTAGASALLPGARPWPQSREPGADDWSDSTIAAELDARFGKRWRFEIREQRREGDEIIVLGRLSVPDKNLSRSHFGAARMGTASGPSGTSQGVAFSLGATVRDERAATRAAALAALDNCASML